ncbi:MAG: mechanosensitive ion channel family protein [Planctomycetes bacterium]|nr:mechanosensitive ion channel family protein [Planctomycetota bacterium]
MNELREFLAKDVLFNRSAGQFIFCLLGILGTLIGRWALVTLIETKFKKWASRTAATWDDLLVKKARRPVSALILVSGVYASVQILEPSDAIAKAAHFAAILLTGIIVAILLVGVVDVLIDAYRPISSRRESRLDEMVLPVVSRILKIGLVIVAVLMVLHNLHVKITPLLTTAGLGGVAIAFGAQKVVSNFFASMTIFADQPFQLAERIRVSGVAGVVEEIGLRSTKLRDDDGVLVTVPNQIIAEGIVENFSRRDSRRVVSKIGVTYETSAEKLHEAQAIIADVLKNEDAIGERHQVSFSAFSDSSLDLEIIYWVKGIGYDNLLAVKHRINSEILRRFAGAGIEMAFPTRTIYHKQAP